MSADLVIERSTDGAAVFSPCRRYRYRLTRVWERHIREAIREADISIAAWCAFRPKSHGNAHNVPHTIAWEMDRPLMALKISNGNPSHPLYLRADSPLVVYSRRAAAP